MMNVPPAAPMARLVARQVWLLMSARRRQWTALISPDPLPAFVFEVVLGATLEPLPLRRPDGAWIGFEQAATAGRPVTGAAIAKSMGLAPTIVLRRANGLVSAGILARSRGFTVAADVFEDGRAEQIAITNAAGLMDIAVVLSEAGHPAAAAFVSAGSPAAPPGVIERLLLSFRLRTLESVTNLYGDIVAAMIVAGVIAANVAEITADPVLGARYADEDHPPPDELRKPVTLRALSRDLRLPFETVRRRTVALIAAGTIVDCGDGVIVPTRVLMTEGQISNNRRLARNFEDMLILLTKMTPDEQNGESAS